MRDLKYLLFMLAVLLTAGVKGQYNPTNPAEPGIDYTLTLEAVPKEGGSFNINATTSYSGGSNVNIRAYTSKGYRFIAWEQDGNVIATSSSITYNIPFKNVKLTARYEYDPSNPTEPDEPYIPTYSVLNIKASPSEGGYFNISSGNRYEVGSTVQLKANTYSFYTFRNWTQNGEVISTSSSFQYVMEQGNPTLVANYDYTPSSPSEPSEPVFTRRLDLNINPSGAGYLNVSGGNGYQSGSSVNLRASSYQNYTFLNWTLGDSVISESSNFNYLMPQSDVTLTANFKFAPSNPNEPSETENQIVNIYGLTETTEPGQTLKYPVYMGNNVDVIGFVVDIFFPNGFEVDADSIILTSRMSDHQLEVNSIDNNGFRLKVRGESQSITGNGGKILDIPVTVPDTALVGQDYIIVLSNGVLHGTDGTLTPIGVRNGTISIDGNSGVQYIRMSSSKSAVYDSSGKQINVDDISKLPPGLYIRKEMKFLIR